MSAERSMELIVFGSQFDRAIQLHHDLQRCPRMSSDLYLDLRGYEESLIKLAGRVVVDRFEILRDLGERDTANQIMESRLEFIAKQDDEALSSQTSEILDIPLHE